MTGSKSCIREKLLNPSTMSDLSDIVALLMLKERGKDDLSFVWPIADLKIYQHIRELFLLSSSMVLKYNVLIFIFNLLNKLLKVLYFLIFSSIGLCS